MNTLVNFEIAKLLKEKGFDDESPYYFNEKGEELFDMDFPSIGQTKPKVYYDRPINADVVMWLYDNHKIWISVDWMSRTKPFNSGFISHLRGVNKYVNSDNFIVINNTKLKGYEVFDSPTEAYEAAIEYCLKNLM